MRALLAGAAYPLGATVLPQGVNFALYAGHAERVELCLYDGHGHEELARLPLPRNTHGVWHGLLPDAGAGLVYGYRVHGPWAPREGHRHNPKKLLLDPYARALVGQYRDHPDFNSHDLFDPQLPDPLDNGALAVKAQVIDERYDWAGETRPETPWARTILYEAHVRGLTMRHPALPPELRGSYAALAHPAVIRHLQCLGITAIELLPVQAHADEPRLQRLGLSNYWGYNPLAPFAPEPRYWSGQGGTPLSEFRDAVKALHAAGIEVILDVVYNHYAELDVLGPTLSLRGIDNGSYYLLDPHGGYENWTGCGNVLNLAHPRVIQWVMDSLRYWAIECHVDGFRFDLAPVLGRTPRYSACAPLLSAIAQDPQLARLKLIAEPWDLGPAGYQLGQFPPGWAEWNDQYRDTLRRFWLHDGVSRGQFARRFAASSDLFQHHGRKPWASVNFITAHDGFTLRDLTSYNRKHNLANGEHNRDGHNQNQSWNCGVEGPSDDPGVNLVRLRARKALLASLLLSQGTPMLLAGDELGHSQGGNNNAYCQDNDITWLDWGNGAGELTEFIGELVRLRQSCPALTSGQWWQGEGDAAGFPDVTWRNPSGEALRAHDWEDGAGRALMVQLSGFFLVLINASANQVPFRLPPGCWRVHLASTEDKDSALYLGECRVAARSLTVLIEEAHEPGLFANPFTSEEQA
ncbi:glycogen debranching protein GlgX [Chitiniphilus purpureus]|uniref:Glycogen debranching protein GlgX n=1 Tax=Chitiniphilus purpureus TaxID=2981137 RepID=A0ABY6DKI7_9NEIS|nr:glycogen debranching protein GlgX [Chitiniphilus sp. CD1]UXY14865.1 glycogen debranching protein GlgX [Chitiniphilus sp. CD1]